MNDQKNKQGKQDDPVKIPHNSARKANTGQEIENPDQSEQPDKKINIDDDPDQTKKKVPNMHN